MDVKERIQQYLDYKHIKVTQFEISIGASSGYWRKTKSVSANIVSQIAGIYSEISAEWLLRGKGEMIITPTTNNESSSIEELKAEINQLKGENRVLREQLGLGERKDSSSQSA